MVQASNTSATQPVGVERRGEPLLQSKDLEPTLSRHIYKIEGLAQYMNQPITLGLIPALGDQYATSSWKSRRNLVMETLHNTDHHFPLSYPTNKTLHPLPDNEHLPIHGVFDGSEDIFAMERIIRPSFAEYWTQPRIAWPAEAESHLGYTRPLSHSLVSCTGSQFYFSLDPIFPPQGSFSLAERVASTTQWKGCPPRYAWNEFEKEFKSGHAVHFLPLHFPHDSFNHLDFNTDVDVDAEYDLIKFRRS